MIRKLFNHFFGTKEAVKKSAFNCSSFHVGDEIGGEKGGVKIRITKNDLYYRSIEAVAIAADDFWTDGVKYAPNQKSYFIIGEVMRFEYMQDSNQCYIEYPSNAPFEPRTFFVPQLSIYQFSFRSNHWFILGIREDGAKYFEHYR